MSATKGFDSSFRPLPPVVSGPQAPVVAKPAPIAPAVSDSSSAVGQGSSDTGATLEGSHDAVEVLKHRVHQGKIGSHSVRDAAEGLRDAALEARELVAARAGVVTLAEKGGKITRLMAGVVEGAEALSAAQAHRLLDASSTLEHAAQLNITAKAAAGRQGGLARHLEALCRRGGDAVRIKALRDELAEASRATTAAFRGVRDFEPTARQARATLRIITGELREAQQASGLVRRALQVIDSVRSGEQAAKLARLVAESRVGAAISVLADSKIVRVGGNVLVVAAAAIDAVTAGRSDATVGGNAFRVVGQGAASVVLYSQPELLPVFVAESFLMNGPHLTGMVAAAVQVGGVAVDYLAGSEAGDRALGTLDAEMKSGKYGAVIKGANYFGQSLADEGLGAMLTETARYWSGVSPRQAWSDVKDIWGWLSPSAAH